MDQVTPTVSNLGFYSEKGARISQKVTTSHNAVVSSNKYSVTMYRFGQAPWLPCEIIHLVCILIGIYLLYALLHYRSVRKFNPNTSARRRKGGLWLENLCLMALLLSLVRFANNQVLLFTGWVSDERCSILLNVSIVLYFLLMQPIYLFLWVRQRIFYSNRALKHIYSKPIRILSWATLICFGCMTITSIVFFVVDNENSATGRVCRHSVKANNNSTELLNVNHNEKNGSVHYQGLKVNTMTGLIAGCIQILFLALFLYPIMDNKLRAMRNLHQKSGTAGLITLIRRSFLLAGLCIMTDVLIALLVKPTHYYFPDAIFAHLAMYDINVIINLLSIIMTFRRWRIMLFPWYYVESIKPICPSICKSRLPGAHDRYDFNKKHKRNSRVSHMDKSTVEDHNGTILFHTKKVNPKIQDSVVECRYSAIPDVIAPCLREELKLKNSLSEFTSESTKNEEYANPKQCSEPVTQVGHIFASRTRSSSLTLSLREIKPGLRRSKSHAATLFLTKSRHWLKKR